jgi:D-beta-D-heptose 7-phosphate kinase/D-beta-D-heptose 1-phosphate adenosyltransferase
MEALLAQLARWRPFSALVVGDFMLDQQVYGDAERLSSDAPVPILHVRRTESQPGGSANVCMDLAALGGRVQAFGVVGEDGPGQLLQESLDAHGVHSSTLVRDPSRPTTLKQNLVGLAQTRHPQKMFRVDYESREDLSPAVRSSILDAFDGALAQADKPDAVCIEDYNKGVCTHDVCQHIISRCRSVGVPVFVDPARGVDYRKYKGATAITPNRTEAEVATGIRCDDEGSPQHNAALAHRLLIDLDLDAVVLTLDRHGALLLESQGPGRAGAPVSIPTIARQVYDVTGAGDMFLAGLAAARANEIDWDGAVRFANAAAGLEVEVFGVQPIPFERVHHSLLMQYSHVDGKLRSVEQARLEVAARRKQGQKVVFTNGCFDVLHSGHVALLEKAAAEGDFLIVGLNDDASVCRLKGPTRPVNNQEDRARVLGALQSVGAVVLFTEDTPLELIRSLKPDVLVKGADYTKERVVGAEIVEAAGGRVALIPLVEGRSSSATIARLKS